MIKYFYTMTLQWQRNGTSNYGLFHGVTEVPEDATQESVYMAVWAAACEAHGAPQERCTVVNYYLARNEL